MILFWLTQSFDALISKQSEDKLNTSELFLGYTKTLHFNIHLDNLQSCILYLYILEIWFSFNPIHSTLEKKKQVVLKLDLLSLILRKSSLKEIDYNFVKK